MSVNTVTVECDDCGEDYSANVVFGLFEYVLEDGTRIQLNRSRAWCYHCERIVAAEDLSGASLLAEIKRYEDFRLKAVTGLERAILPSSKREIGGRIEEFDKELRLLDHRMTFLSTRYSHPKCLSCGGEDFFLLPEIPYPHENGQRIPAGWFHPGCGGKMFAVLQDYRLFGSNEPHLYDEDGLAFELTANYAPDLSAAEAELDAEFGLSLDKVPDKHPVVELFNSMSVTSELTHEAQVALLYRLVAMNFLTVCKLMRDSGQNTAPEKLVWLTSLLDSSVNWSESATDHGALESATSQLNKNIESFLHSFGVIRG